MRKVLKARKCSNEKVQGLQESLSREEGGDVEVICQACLFKDTNILFSHHELKCGFMNGTKVLFISFHHLFNKQQNLPSPSTLCMDDKLPSINTKLQAKTKPMLTPNLLKPIKDSLMQFYRVFFKSVDLRRDA